MTEWEILAKNIRKYRQRKGLLQTDLAAKVGLSSDSISKIELGKERNIGFKYLVAICRELDAPIEELLLESPRWLTLRIVASEKNIKVVEAIIQVFKNLNLVQ